MKVYIMGCIYLVLIGTVCFMAFKTTPAYPMDKPTISLYYSNDSRVDEFNGNTSWMGYRHIETLGSVNLDIDLPLTNGTSLVFRGSKGAGTRVYGFPIFDGYTADISTLRATCGLKWTI